MPILKWILIHSEQDNLVRVNIDDGLRPVDSDMCLADLPQDVQDAINAMKVAVCAHFGASWYEPPKKEIEA